MTFRSLIRFVAGTIRRSEVGEGLAGHYGVSRETIQRASKATRLRVRVHPK